MKLTVHSTMRSRSRAFTMVELVTSLVVVAVLSVLAQATYATTISNSHVDVAQASALEVSHAAVSEASSSSVNGGITTISSINHAVGEVKNMGVDSYVDTGSMLQVVYSVNTANSVVNTVCVDIPDVPIATPQLCPAVTKAPSPPTSVSAAPVSNTQINVFWTAPTPPAAVTYYTIRYSSDGGSTWTIASSSATGSAYTVSNLSPSTAYIFQVSATNQIGTSAYSVSSAAVSTNATPTNPVTPLSTPIPSVTANINTSPGTMAWGWTSSTGGSGNITYYWSISPQPALCPASNTSSTTVTCLNSMTPGTTYTFSVFAQDTSGDTSPVGQVTATQVSSPVTTTTAAPDSAPVSTPTPQVTTDTSSSTTGTMSWSWPSVNGGTSPYTYYWSISPAPSGCASGSTSSTGTACSDVMTPGVTYTFSLYAQDSLGATSSTGSVTATQAAAPTTTTTAAYTSALAYPLVLTGTYASCSYASPVLTLTGNATVVSGGGLAPIGVNSTCARAVTLANSASLSASSIQTANSALTTYCYLTNASKPTSCSSSQTGPTEVLTNAASDPFSTLTPPSYPSTQPTATCSGTSGTTTCPAGQYATSPALNSNSTNVTFGSGSGTFVFQNPLYISNGAHVTFGPGSYWFAGGLNVSGSSSVTFGQGTYIFGNPSSNNCPSSTCLSVSGGANVATTSSGALLYVAASAANLTGNGTMDLTAMSAYSGVALWDAAASGSSYPLIVANSGTAKVTSGGIYVPNGQAVLTGVGNISASFVEAQSANLSNSSALVIG